MSAQREEPLRRVPMSWQQYLELPEKPRAEWVDGVALIMNAPRLWSHSDSTLRLGALLLAALPRHHVGTEAALKLPRNRVRLPDLMVIEKVPADGWVVEPPLMVAEVLSRSTRSEDLVRKSVEYREAGVGQYWLVDPELRTLEVMANGEDAWETVLRLDDDHPEGSVVLAGTTIPLDLRVILRADAN